MAVQEVLLGFKIGIPRDLVTIVLGYLPLQFTSSGHWDKHGLLYAVATCFGCSVWRNPALTGLVNVTRCCKLVSRNLPASALAQRGPSLSGAIWAAWLEVDLGVGVLLQPTSCTVLVADGSGYRWDRWECSASVDHIKWDVFRVSPGGCGFSSENPGFHADSLITHVADLSCYYRHIRLRYLGSYPPPLRAIELYGHVCWM
jgi:hypothetical protein